MKKLLLFIGIVICFTACESILKNAFKNIAVEKITITGKVVDAESNPIENCRVTVRESPGLMVGWGSIDKKDTITNKSGEFILEFSPRQDENFTGSYSISVEKRNYICNNYYSIDKTKSKQHLDIVMHVIKDE